MSAPTEYGSFLERKGQLGTFDGFDPGPLPGFLFDFQAALVAWALRKGKAAIFADTGLGKTAIQLAWADAIVRRTNRPVLLLTPLAVGAQTAREAERFGIPAARSMAGEVPPDARIVVANYERLHHFDPAAFAGTVCDESSILKNFDGVRRGAVTEFMKKQRYRLLCTATAAPNDYAELGTSSEAIGELGFMDMLGRFFKNDANTVDTRRRWGAHGGAAPREKWRFKGHAETPFWRWVASWARAMRRPSDLGFDDGRFALPPLVEEEHVIATATLPDGWLFATPAVGMREERDELRRTVRERCEYVAHLLSEPGARDEPALVWCQANAEGDLLEEMIPGAVQVAGSDADESKEEKFLAFASGEARVLVTKPKIGAWGLNFQHCARVTFFPSHSFEQYYQGVRRCWRFGQTRPVRVDVVSTEGQAGVLANLRRKAVQSDRMFAALVAYMNDAITLDRARAHDVRPEVPSWLS